MSRDRVSTRRRRVSSKAKAKSNSGGLNWRPLFGVLALLFGVLILIGVIVQLATKGLDGIKGTIGGAMIVTGVLISIGIKWIRGETAE